MADRNRAQGRARTARSLPVRLAHMLLLLCTVASLISGYVAFDFRWSGVSQHVRPPFYIIHQTSGLLIPLAAAWLLAALALERRSTQRIGGPPRLGMQIYHYGLVVAVLCVSVLGLMATGCGNRSLMFLGLVAVKLPVPQFICANGLPLFSAHQPLAGYVLVLAAAHAVGALFHRAIFGMPVMRPMFWPERAR